MINVSIIIPVFNMGSYIREAINSCLEQTLTNIEIIVINDGSTDSSDLIIKEYAGNLKNFRYKIIEHGGLSKARNEGLKLASGKYILFLDADDYISPDTCEKLFNQAEKDELDFVTFDAETILDSELDEKTMQYFSYDRSQIISDRNYMSGKDFIRKYREKGGIKVNACLSFVNRDFLEKNNIDFPEGLFYEDNVFFLQCMMYAKKTSYNSNKFYKRRLRKNSIMTQTVTPKHLLDVYYIDLKLVESVACLIHNEILTDEMIYFWLDYISWHSRVMFGVLDKQSKRLLTLLFRDYYSQILNIIIQCVKNVIEILDSTKSKLRAISVLDKYIFALTECSKVMPDCVIDMFTKYKVEIVKEKLSKIPLQRTDLKVGIYGSGPHSDFVLELYKRLIGDIKAEIFYIDSSAVAYESKHNGIDIINILDVDFKDVDAVVILSFKFEEEMRENLRRQISFSTMDTEIYTFYDGEDYPIDCFDMHEKKYEEYRKDAVEHRVFLLNTPVHDNIGDHIIAEQTKKLIYEVNKDTTVIEVTGEEYMVNPWKIRQRVGWLDTVIVNGGGYFGNLWGSGETLLEIAKMFKENRLILMPQSFTFKKEIESTYINEWKRVLECATDIKLLWRDKQSYENALKWLGFQDRHYLLPDVALFCEPFLGKQTRSGITLCLRNDSEGLLSDEDKAILKTNLSCLSRINETSMHYGSKISVHQRDYVIEEKMKEVSSAKIVVTDTLHCMILCALTGTKCVALANSTGKVAGVYDWIKDLDYIKYTNNNDEIVPLANQLLNSKSKCEYKPGLENEKKKIIDILDQDISFNRPVYINVACADGRKIYFMDCQTDYLFVWDDRTRKIEIIEELHFGMPRGMRFSYMTKYKQCIWLVPWSDSRVFSYDLQSKELVEYSVINNTEKMKYAGYRKGVIDGDNLWLLPNSDQCIYCIDMNELTIRKANGWPKGVKFNNNSTMNFKCMNLKDKKIYLFADGCSHNQVIDTTSMEISKWSFNETKSFGVALSNENVLLSPIHSGNKLRVLTGNIIKELELPAKAWQKEKYYSYWYCTVVGTKVYIMPHEANGFLSYDIEKQEVKYIDLTSHSFDTLRPNKGFSGYDVISMDDRIFVIPYMGAQILELKNDSFIASVDLKMELPVDVDFHGGKYQFEMGSYFLQRFIKTAFRKVGMLERK